MQAVATSTAAPAHVCHHTATQVIAATATTVPSPGEWRQPAGISSYADEVQATVRQRPVPGGPRHYRTRIRSLGPIVGLIPPAILGVLALLLLNGSTGAARGVTGFGLALFAAPGLLFVGAPLSTGSGVYLLAIAASAVLWLAIGVVAARRATRSPAPTWRDFWREWAWPAAGVWLGVIVALLVADLVLGKALF